MREQGHQIHGLDRYRGYLLQEERAPSTVENYLRDVRAFAVWLDGRAATKELAAARGRGREGLELLLETICATSSPQRSTARRGTSRSWPICWGTTPSTPPAST